MAKSDYLLEGRYHFGKRNLSARFAILKNPLGKVRMLTKSGEENGAIPQDTRNPAEKRMVGRISRALMSNLRATADNKNLKAWTALRNFYGWKLTSGFKG